MRMGALGQIPFETAFNPDSGSFTREGEVNAAVHNRMNNMGLLEPTGLSPEKLSFRLTLDYAWLGTKLPDYVQKVWDMKNSQVSDVVVIGKKVYGTYLIKSLKESQVFHADGTLTRSIMDVELLRDVQ